MEALCSGLALERDATSLGRAKPESPLGRIVAEHGKVTGRATVAAARDGDPDAVELLQKLGTWLGVGISNAMNVFEPEVDRDRRRPVGRVGSLPAARD